MATIIFDMDGTIADSFDYVADFLAGEARRGPLSSNDKQALRHLSMVGMAKRLGFHWWDGPRLFFKGRRRMNRSIRDLQAFKGMPELIGKLNAEGHELFMLSTNSVRNIRHFLRRRHLHTYFLEIYGGVGLFGKGPALRQLLRDQNIDIKNAVYVGDELRDVQAAQSIGLRVVAVSWGFAGRHDLQAAKPLALVDNPAELLRVLEDI
jgi:phosphoglycolate phosphatase